MRIEVYCHKCPPEAPNGYMEHRKMAIYGPLFFNPRTKTQSQEYKCMECFELVTVLVLVE